MHKSHPAAFGWRELGSWFVVAAIALITIFAYFVSYYGWQIYLELLAHLQVQYFILSLILLGVLILLRRKSHIYLGLFFCTVLSLQTLTWFWLPSHLFTTGDQESDLRILIANINTQNKNYDLVLNLVRIEKPDVAVFMEVDRQWQDKLNTLSDLLPYSSGKTNSYNLGLLAYSNLPLNNPQIKFFNTENNASVVTQLTVSGQTCNFIGYSSFTACKTQLFSVAKHADRSCW